MGVTQLSAENITLDFSNDRDPQIYLQLNFTLEILQEPVGVLAYLDKIIYEGRLLSRESLGTWLPPPLSAFTSKKKDKKGLNENLTKNPRFYEHANSSVTARIERVSDSEVTFSIKRPLKHVNPGIYVMHSKIVDFWGQPYFDNYFIFRVRSVQGNAFDIGRIEEKDSWIEDEWRKLKHELSFFFQARASMYRHGVIGKIEDLALQNISLQEGDKMQ